MLSSRRQQVFAALTFVLLYATLGPAVAQVSAPTAPEPPAAPSERTAASGTVGEVVIVEATQGDKQLELGEVTTSRLSAPVTLEEQKGGAIAKAEVRLSHFRHENGTTHEAKFVLEQGETLATLGESGSVRGSIQVDLPLSGAYKGQLRIVHDGTVRSRYTVTVMRKSVAAPITVGDLNAILVQRSCGPVILDVNTTFRATGGAPLALPAPSVSITRTLKDDQVVGVPEASAVLLDGEGKPVETTTVPTQLTPVRLRIAGFEEAGKHQIKMQFAPAGYEPIDRTFTVYVKDPWGLAALFIFLGVVASFVLRFYWTEKRPRLLVERRVASLMDRLARAERDAAGDATALEVIALMRGALGEAWRDVALSDKWSETTAFDLPEKKASLLPSWISARRLVAGAKPAALKEALEKVLEPVESALRRSAVEATELETNRETLENFKSTFDDKVREAIDAVIGDLERLTADYSAARPAAQARLVAEMRSEIADARTKVKAKDTTGALEALDRGRRGLVSIVANDIAGDLSGPPAVAFDAAGWGALRDGLAPLLEDAKQHATAETATARLESALELFVGTMCRKLAEKVAAELPSNSGLKSIAADLAAAQTKLGEGKIAAAWQDVAAAQSAYAAAAKAPAGAAMGLGAPAAPAAPSALPLDMSALGAAGPASSREGFVPPGAGSLATIQEQLTAGDWLASLAILLIATIVGVNVLWSGELVWGTWTDRVVALVWGLGLHQFTFDGIAGLTNKLRS